MAVVVEGGLALVALVLAWLFNVPVRDLFPKVRATADFLKRAASGSAGLS